MYRIRLESGEEAVYRSAEELALAVSSGVVSPTAEVFHNAASRWLPINIHPDYRAVITGKGPALPALPEPEPSLGDLPPSLEGEAAASLEPQGPPLLSLDFTAEYDPARDPTPLTAAPGPPPHLEVSRARKLRTMLALAMGLAAMTIVGGGSLAAWRYLLPWLEAHRPGPVISEGMPPDPGLDTDSAPTVYPAPRPPLPLVAESTAEVTPPPGTRTTRLPATRNRNPGYLEAYADARAEMDESFAYVNFQRVFAASRFATPESLRAARRMVQAAANILRVYRGREVMLEQTYRPDDPGGQGTFREPFETAEATRALLANIDSLYGVVLTQQGRFSYNGETVSFEDSHAAEEYGDLRRQILITMGQWRDSAASRNLVTMPRLIRALAGAAPPLLKR